MNSYCNRHIHKGCNVFKSIYDKTGSIVYKFFFSLWQYVNPYFIFYENIIKKIRDMFDIVHMC